MRTERDRACPNIIAYFLPHWSNWAPQTDSLASSEVAELRRFLILVADPRDARGVRYPALALLCAAVSAVLTGARSLIAISEWITDAPQQVLSVLGFAADPLTGLRQVPHAATVRRPLQRVDGDALDAAISAYLQARTPSPAEPAAEKRPVRRVIAVDGKVVRGSRTATTAAIQLLAAMDHHGVVLAQRQVASKSNEIPSFAPLLDGLELENTVVTADALHTQHDHGAHLTSRGAHYVAVVKKNRPGLYAQFRKLPWRDIPLGHRTRDHAHHRDEIRRLKVAAFSHLDCPGARQAIQVVWWRRDLTTGRLTIERVCLITGLSVFDATCTELATWTTGHWGIENLLHHVCDRTFREDDSKIRTGTLPRAMASCATSPSAVFRQDGQTSIAAALRHTGRDYHRPLRALGLT